MATTPKSGKSDVLRNRESASRLSYLRSGTFSLEGFGYHDNPTLSDAISMATRNRVKIVGGAREGDFRTPSVRS